MLTFPNVFFGNRVQSMLPKYTIISLTTHMWLPAFYAHLLGTQKQTWNQHICHLGYKFDKTLNNTLITYFCCTRVLLITIINLATKSTEHLVPFIDELMKSLGVVGDIVSLTGEEGMLKKYFLFKIFGGRVTRDNWNICWILCTKASNCGVGSTKAILLERIDFTPNFSKRFQEIRRAVQGKTSGGLPYSWNGLFNINS